MTLDEALLVLSNRAEDQLGKLEVLLKRGGSLRATDEAMEIARECIKRCRDFEALRDTIGRRVYILGIDKDFPEESWIAEYTVSDMSVNGLINLGVDDEWFNPSDTDEYLFWSREEAEEKLEELKR